ncbi:MAG: DUF559 domain-containing protein, partial [Betaproteobacteria bacterium]|nr:DUF559 domain-containing protein [Betaproteobacteria bacterium]NCA17880.1 DUF559 domain-containing protein [Betaproteobacteria bacterium]
MQETARRVAQRGHSEETKLKISRARKAYLDAHPEKVPYVINHYSKGPSYPERYFSDIFKSKGIELVEQHQVGRYCLDFALLDKKIDIEIDGEQHYLDPRIQRSDEERTRFLESEKWKVVRVRWSMYQSLTQEQKGSFVEDLVKQLRDFSSVGRA